MDIDHHISHRRSRGKVIDWTHHSWHYGNKIEGNVMNETCQSLTLPLLFLWVRCDGQCPLEMLFLPHSGKGSQQLLLLTQDVSKCEKILEMKKIDFSCSLPISKSTKMMKNGAWLFCLIYHTVHLTDREQFLIFLISFSLWTGLSPVLTLWVNMWDKLWTGVQMSECRNSLISGNPI